MEKLLTVKEAKLLLGVTTHTIQEWDKKELIRAVRTPVASDPGERDITDTGRRKKERGVRICTSILAVAERRFRATDRAN